jgi:hypothetical protein
VFGEDIMYYERDELLAFAHEAIASMLSYNVKRKEAYAYLTNKVDLMHTSYELQCCIFDVDPLEYIRECDKLNQNKIQNRRPCSI